MNNSLSADKRVFERFSARFPSKFKDAREDYSTNVFLRDASADGFRLTTRERLFLNDHVTLEVKLPDAVDPLFLKGQVVWSRVKDGNLWDVGVKCHKVDLLGMSRLYKFSADEIPV